MSSSGRCSLCNDFGLVVVGRDEWMLNCPGCNPVADPVEYGESAELLERIEWIDYQKSNQDRTEVAGDD